MKNWLKEIFKNYFIKYFPFILVFLASLYNTADSDLGWHLKYGQFFFQHHRILRENIFSTEMKNYLWVNSSWATDLLSFLAFDKLGFLGITLLGGIVMMVTFYFFSKAARLSFWEEAILFPLILFLIEPLTIVSFRGQLLTLMFLGFLYFLLSRFEKNQKLLMLTIPLFILWSNFHGEFILGLFIFCVWIICYILKTFFLHGRNLKSLFSKEIKLLLTIYISSVLASLINPYGIGVFQEVFRHFGNPMQKYIIEWLPFDKFSAFWWQFVLWGIIISISLLILRKNKQLLSKLPFIGPLIILLILSFFIRRYAWPMYLISIPVTAHFISRLKPSNKLVASLLPSIIIIILYLNISFIKIPSMQFQSMSWEKYCEEYVKCSFASAEFLKKQNIRENLLTFYNWGGWLIWNYPEIIPSIDGRMHLWVDNNGYSAFKEYYPLEQKWADTDKSKYDTVYMTSAKPMVKQMLELVKSGRWKILYQDKYAYIFQRVKIPTKS